MGASMSDRSVPETGGETRLKAGARDLRSDLLHAARVHDHLDRVSGRAHLWIALTALVGMMAVFALARHFMGGKCCAPRKPEASALLH